MGERLGRFRNRSTGTVPDEPHDACPELLTLALSRKVGSVPSAADGGMAQVKKKRSGIMSHEIRLRGRDKRKKKKKKG